MVDTASGQQERFCELVAVSLIHPELKELLTSCVNAMSDEAVARLVEAFEQEAEWLLKLEAELRLASDQLATVEASLREEERAIVRQRIESFIHTLQAGGSAHSGNASL